jgi:hypothetical protein
MLTRLLIYAVLMPVTILLGADQKYNGPRPPKPDLPYLLHADNLVETEPAVDQSEEKGNQITHSIPGVSSSARTPMAEPIFLFEAQKLNPEKLELYRLEVRRGRREVTFAKKQSRESRPLRLMVTPIEGKLYRIEVNETLENGEYALTPEDSDQVFAFQVY